MPKKPTFYRGEFSSTVDQGKHLAPRQQRAYLGREALRPGSAIAGLTRPRDVREMADTTAASRSTTGKVKPKIGTKGKISGGANAKVRGMSGSKDKLKPSLADAAYSVFGAKPVAKAARAKPKK